MRSIDSSLASGSAPVPVTVLTGFLGAGKTTLLNRILNGDHGLRVAVLVNDFGSINVDAELVVRVGTDVVSLANGCVCCTIREDLVSTLFEALERPERPEYVVLEASGVAEPSSIAMTFNNPGFRDRIRLDSILCLVDAEQFLADPRWLELKAFQMACADMIVLNKVDLVERAEIDRIARWLDHRFHRYRLLESIGADVPLAVVLSVGRFDPATLEALESHDHDHAHTFSTWSYETSRPLALDRVRDAVKALPGGVYRVKGVIRSADAPDRRAVLQVVGRRIDLTLEDEWGERERRTRIVAIGSPGAIDEHELRAAFDGCASVSADAIDRAGSTPLDHTNGIPTTRREES